jgi:cell division protein FtsB
VENSGEPPGGARGEVETIAALRREIVELKARVAELAVRNAELVTQINNERYERPPHY